MLWYETLEQVKASMDVKATARDDVQVARAIESACRAVEGELGRRFYPQIATYSLHSPDGRRLYLDAELDLDLIEVDTFAIGGVAVPSADYTLLPLGGPPYNIVEFEARHFNSGYRPVQIAGLWGYDNVTEPAGALAAEVASASATTVDVTDGSGTGVGSLLLVGTERMVVTARGQLDTGEALQSALTAQMAGTVVEVADGAQIHVGEVLLVDEERMLVVDVAGNDVVVKRAWDGSVLAAHNDLTAVYALRRLTVERGVLGTTAATHANGAAVVRQVYPGPVVSYVVSLAQLMLLQEITGQQHAPGGHTFGTTISADRERAMAACGRESGFA